MSTIKTNTITDVAGSGGPTLTNGATFGTAAFAAPSGTAPMYACRAWVNFNGTGTVAINASGNVTSITDGGTGNYTVNFTTSMPDANYSTNVNAANPGSGNTYGITNPTRSASAVGFQTRNVTTATNTDLSVIDVSVLR